MNRFSLAETSYQECVFLEHLTERIIAFTCKCGYRLKPYCVCVFVYAGMCVSVPFVDIYLLIVIHVNEINK